ncbi:hypothetical protein FQA39_LY09021 [Lamprigera yunnana]|nr:hypothetical protein FQA39_LY09021 [Lamprigera yunnana]
MWLIILLGVLTAIIYFYLIKPLNYWKERNVPYERPLPIFGNSLGLITKKFSNAEFFAHLYNKFPDTRYTGAFNFGLPFLVIRDPELMKRIFVKDFDTFPQHTPFISKDVDPLWNKNLFAMEDAEEWHELRATLSPSFTSSKIKAMFILMRECSRQFSNHFLKQGESIEVDLKDCFGKFANDVIATTAYGITCDSLSNPNNEFYVTAKQLNDFTGIKGFLFLLNLLSPTLAKFIKTPVFSKQAVAFFYSVVKETIKVRKEKGIVRMDMLHLLMEAQKGSLKYEENQDDLPEAGFAAVEESNIGKTQKPRKMEITDEIIVAQALVFFFAGAETVSTSMGFAGYELAVNPEIQDRLREEVDQTLSNSDGQFTYENLMSMKYLDMIVSEVLRKWPPNIATDRKSVKSFTIEAEQPGEPTLFLEKGAFVACPIEAIHRDPKYYPNPDKFDPERFNEANRHNIRPYTYLPFGLGPRNCIGSRFALLEIKLIIAEVISKFQIVPIERTQIPLIMSKSAVNSTPQDGFWVGFKKRTL